MSETAESPRFARLRRGYVAFAVHVANVVVALVAVNLALGVLFAARDGWSRRVVAENPTDLPKDKLARAYGDVPMDVIEGTLHETWDLMKLEAQPWTHFGEAPFSGKYVNVAAGARSNGAPRAAPQGDPPPLRVFMFGGSTTFGYGVPDRETIPAHLERILRERHPGARIEVYNYGRGYYFSAQEQALFFSLLRRGIRPDVAIFLDGLNEQQAAHVEDGHVALDEPWGMSRIREMWRRSTEPSRGLPDWIPIARLANAIAKRARHPPIAAQRPGHRGRGRAHPGELRGEPKVHPPHGRGRRD